MRLYGVEEKDNGRKTVNLPVRVVPEVLTWLKDEAAREGRSLSGHVRWIIKQHMERGK